MACSRGKRIEKLLRENRVGAGERRSIVACKHCFQYLLPDTSSGYALWLVNCDSSLQRLRQSFNLAHGGSYKHVKYMKPSYNALFEGLKFDILTWETVF